MLEEQREGKKFAIHNVPLNSFHDARSTIQSIESQVRLLQLPVSPSDVLQLSQLHSRTGLEFLLVSCRSTTDDFVKPFACFSSDRIKSFFNSSLNRSVDNFALQLEAYVMSGIKGMDAQVTGSYYAH